MFCAGVSNEDEMCIKIFDFETRTLTRMLCGHTSSVSKVKFVPWNEYKLASSAEDNTVRVWDLIGNEEMACFQYDSHVSWMAFQMDTQTSVPSEFLVTCTSGFLCKHNLATHAMVFKIRLPVYTSEICVCLDGQLILTTDTLGGKILDASTGNTAHDTLNELEQHFQEQLERHRLWIIRSCAGNDRIVAIILKAEDKSIRNTQVMILSISSVTSVSSQMWVEKDPSVSIDDMYMSGDGSKLICFSATVNGCFVLHSNSMTLLKIVQTPTGVSLRGPSPSYTGDELAYMTDGPTVLLLNVETETVVFVFEDIKFVSFSTPSHILM